ncbi:MAG: transposase [Bacteroidaceae bacterium]|nr:transposase [Bacteroidaceae bacterium]
MAKGRSKELISVRDQRLFERYYYWTEVRRLRIDDTITKLSKEEFFISESRVMQIVRRMILNGATVEGKTVDRPLFTGFRVAAKAEPKSKPSAVRQLLLFPE